MAILKSILILLSMHIIFIIIILIIFIIVGFLINKIDN